MTRKPFLHGATITSLDEVAERQRTRLSVVGFVEGSGGRRDDCSSYTRCLGDYTRFGQAMCPRDCVEYAPRDRRRDVDLAASSRSGEAAGAI